MTKQLISVEDALAQVLQDTQALPAEMAPLHQAAWRILSAGIAARRTQPPFDCAAMDGYAVTDADAAEGRELDVIGESAAGKAFAGAISPGQAARIFTGAPMPAGATSVVMQEDVTALAQGRILMGAGVTAGRHVRTRGLDFTEGQQLLDSGTLLDPGALSLSAAAGHAQLPVHRKPRVAILATGDELVAPGTEPGPDQIVASNGYGVSALVQKAGGDVLDLGIVADDHQAIANAVTSAFEQGADVLVTLGGASVGDHDLIKPVLAGLGIPLGFWKIAMRPGKPLMHGRHGKAHVLGLPGNPVSSLVCANLFLLPLLARLSGRPFEHPVVQARLASSMKANEFRQDYVRARLTRDADKRLIAEPFRMQDSSMLSVLAASDGLIIRPPFAAAAAAGDSVPVLLLR